MTGLDHPSPFGPHPWTDPFAPQDPFNPRPDQHLVVAGALAPRPQDFPYTEQGRQEYYAAVTSASQRQQMMQHAHMARLQAAQEQAAADDARVKKERALHLLLLLTP